MRWVIIAIVLLGNGACALGQELCIAQEDVLVPEETLSRYKRFGFNFDIHEDILAVSESWNDTQTFRGGAVHIYDYGQQDWTRLTSIQPDEPVAGLQLGRDVALYGDALAAIARPQNDNGGTNQDVLYLFDKEEGRSWLDYRQTFVGRIDSSLSESAILQVFNMDFYEDVLAVAYVGGSSSQVALYHYDPVMGLQQTAEITPPLGENGGTSLELLVAVSEDLLVVGVPDFPGDENESSGKAFLYVRRDDGSWPSEPSATLVPSLPNQQRFGSQVVVHQQTLVVACDYGTENGRFEPKAFVYEEPDTGWDGTLQETAILRTGQQGSYFSTVVLAANDNYVFYGKSIEAALSIFEKTGDSWKDQSRTSLLLSPVIGLNFGDQIKASNEHLVLNLPGDLQSNDFSFERLYSYEPPGGNFTAVEEYTSLLVATDSSAAEDRFGDQLSHHGNWMAVTAAGDDEGAPGAGAVYLYQKSAEATAWTLSQVLRSPSTAAFEGFGAAHDLRDSLLFVAAPFHENRQGIVYSYRLTAEGWELTGSVLSPEIAVPGVPVDNSRKGFGRAIALHDEVLAITQFNATNRDDRGRVHLYEDVSGTWQFIGSLRPEDDSQFDFFGREVIISDSLIVVAAGGRPTVSEEDAKVYVYRKKGNQWQGATEDARLLARNQRDIDQFGLSIAMHDDLIVVGALNSSASGELLADSPDISAGAAYVFQRPTGGWSGSIPEKWILTPNEPIPSSNFGYQVHIDSRYLFVSAPHFNEGASSVSDLLTSPAGQVYVFDRDLPFTSASVHEVSILEAESGSLGDGFGKEIEVIDDVWMIGAPRASTDRGVLSGAVYQFRQSLHILDPGQAFCVDGAPVDLSVTGAENGIWSGSGITDAVQGTFDPSALAPGGYRVSFESGDCQSSIVIDVASPPELVDGSDYITFLCEGGSVPLFAMFDAFPGQLEWSYRATPTMGWQRLQGFDGSATVNVTEPGEYLLAFGNKGCMDARAFVVELSDENRPEIISRAPDGQEVCEGNPGLLFVDVRSVLDVDFSWFYRPDSTSGFESVRDATSTSSLTVSEPGNYLVEVSNGSCVEAVSFDVLAPVINSSLEVAGSTVLCEGETRQLTLDMVGDATSYQWYFQPTNSFSFVASPGGGAATSVSAGGSYYCEFVVDGCSFQSDTIDILTPEVDFVLDFPDLICSSAEMIELSARPTGGTWRLDGELITGTILDASQLANGEVELTYEIDSLGCLLSSINTVKVFVTEGDEVPNAFTSNGDGINDVFAFDLFADLVEMDFTVVDRSGAEVYRTQDPGEPWDGGGSPTGTYFWSLSYFDECQGDRVVKSGSVYLLR